MGKVSETVLAQTLTRIELHSMEDEMSGYNMEFFISDFASRTKANLDIVEKVACLPMSGQEEAYEVTQLINSFLGLVVLPNEKFKKWNDKKNTELRTIEKNLWAIIKECEKEHRYYSSYSDKSSGNIVDLIGHLRNCISHSGKMGLHFYPVIEGGDEKITHIIFYDSDYYLIKQRNGEEQAHNSSKEFCLKLTIEEAKQMVKLIADLYAVVEKTAGEDKDYKIRINLLNDLLANESVSGDTVAEQLDRAF